MDEKMQFTFDKADDDGRKLPDHDYEGKEEVWQTETTKNADEGKKESSRSLQGGKARPAKSRARHAKHSSRNRDGMPRRPLSAYNFFFKEQRELLLREREQEQQNVACSIGSDKIGFESMAKIIGGRWKRIKNDDLDRYKVLAENDNKRYRTEMDEYLRQVAAEIARNRQERPRPAMLPLSSRVGPAICNDDTNAPSMMSMKSMLSILSSSPAPFSPRGTVCGSDQIQYPGYQKSTSCDRLQDLSEKMRNRAMTRSSSAQAPSIETNQHLGDFMSFMQEEKPAAVDPDHGQIIDFLPEGHRGIHNAECNFEMDDCLSENRSTAGIGYAGDSAQHDDDSNKKSHNNKCHIQSSVLEDQKEQTVLDEMSGAHRKRGHGAYEDHVQPLFSFENCDDTMTATSSALLEPSEEAALLCLIDQFSSMETDVSMDDGSWMQLMEPRPIAPGATSAESASLVSQQVSNQPASSEYQHRNNPLSTHHQSNLDDANNLREFALWLADQ